ncbi:MAG: hypothetical protein HYU99_05710 [Deltaproteobacteria bacterium]|nr:hypothetical protein [Deltaproteobacteria bacterium]
MRIDYLSRFDRAFKELPLSSQNDVVLVIEKFLDQLQKGTRSQGIGFRRLKGNIWEIRSGLQYRVLLELNKDWISFLFVGTHDEVRKFLRHC